jgi:thioredoxin-dependent peroxiredoxin
MILQAGTKVPDVTVNDQNGNPVNIGKLKGKKIVLYFYPKDQTPGCTAEACSLRDNYQALLKQGYLVYGVSTDSEKSHLKFIKKENLPFPLLADPDKKLHEAFGTWGEKSMYGRSYMGTLRTTFVINEDGVVEEVIEKVDTKNHADQILKKETLDPNDTKKPGVKTTPKKTAKTPAKKATASSAKSKSVKPSKTAPKKVKKTAKKLKK